MATHNSTEGRARGQGHVDGAQVACPLGATRPLAQADQTDPLARQYYGRPPLREVLLRPEGAQAPAVKYLDWHRRKVFVA